jgi:hypothetical protein
VNFPPPAIKALVHGYELFPYGDAYSQAFRVSLVPGATPVPVEVVVPPDLEILASMPAIDNQVF